MKNQSLKKVFFLLAMVIGVGTLFAQEQKMMKDSIKNKKDKMSMDKMDQKMMGKVDVKGWPKASQMAVKEVTEKYGEPNGITENELIWTDAGVWKKIRISKEETKHNFPVEHTDMMQMTIQYDVPQDKMDELGQYDGSVTFDRTQGLMSARCDLEANNFLALNLANDIITDKKTVEEARKAYADIVKEMMNGGKPEYQQKLVFSSQGNTADPDKNTTGLTKKEVMDKMKGASKGK